MLLSTMSPENNLHELLRHGMKTGVFPGAVAGVVFGPPAKRQRFITAAGHAALIPEQRTVNENHFFDLASLTKPLGTTLALLCLLKEGEISLASRLDEMLFRHIPEEKKSILLRSLLSHSAGLPSYRHYYKELARQPLSSRRQLLENMVFQEPLEYEPGTKSVYSDLGFMILGWIIEEMGGKPLDQYIGEKVLAPLQLTDRIFFKPASLFSDKERMEHFVATEECPWRGKVICGEAHDENTFVLEGVSGQAGMFGNIGGVLDLATHVLDMWKDRAHHPYIANSDLKHFLRKQGEIPQSSRALGFDTVSLDNSSAGRYFSGESVGHLGFTGTSFWLEPAKDLVVVLLTNRIHPTRDNVAIRQFRPLFHDTVYKIVEEFL